MYYSTGFLLFEGKFFFIVIIVTLLAVIIPSSELDGFDSLQRRFIAIMCGVLLNLVWLAYWHIDKSEFAQKVLAYDVVGCILVGGIVRLGMSFFRRVLSRSTAA